MQGEAAIHAQRDDGESCGGEAFTIRILEHGQARLYCLLCGDNLGPVVVYPSRQLQRVSDPPTVRMTPAGARPRHWLSRLLEGKD